MKYQKNDLVLLTHNGYPEKGKIIEVKGIWYIVRIIGSYKKIIISEGNIKGVLI